MSKADDILKKYGISQVRNSEGNGSVADGILRKYGVSQVRNSENNESVRAAVQRRLKKRPLVMATTREDLENEEWSRLSQNEDFLQKSGYASTEVDGFWDRFFSEFGMGYGDSTYEYINNQNGFRSAYRDKFIGKTHSFEESPMEKKGYGYLNDKEIAVYNYYYATEGKEKADGYLKSIEEQIRTRKAEAMFTGLEGDTGQEMLFGVQAGLDQFVSGVANAFNTEDDYISQTSYQILSGMVREDLADVGPAMPEWIGGNTLGQLGYDAVTTTSNMAPSILVSMLPGGQFAGLALMGSSAAGNAYQRALSEGYDKKQARLYSTLIGASEALLQRALGGIGTLGGTSAAITRAVSGIENGLLRFALEFGGKVGSEALDEGLQEILDPIFKNVVMGTDEKVDWANVAYSALLGGMMGAGYGAPEVAVSHLSNAEASVVKKELNDRIAEKEKGGKKLTAKQKNELYDEVLRDMEKGRISSDAVEAILGRDSRKAYDALQKDADEFKTLYDTPTEQLSERQKDRLAVLKEKNNAKSYEEALAEARQNSFRDSWNAVKGTRLEESFRERARSGQSFEADLSKYDAKQQAVIKKAVESGILNNTTRTHEFVDMIAKISADKDILFDFTNNERLKASGFALDGKTVNGYVTKDGVTLNINSAKALNTVVGHEITHVLEGTEFYDYLRERVFNYAISKEGLDSFNARLKAIEKLYNGMENTTPEAELMADLVGDYLFTDADFVNRLSAENRNVFQKLYDEIKYICRVVSAGSEEARELEKVRKIFEDAYKAQKNTVTEDGVKYSLGQQSSTNAQSQYAYMKPFADQLVDYQNGNIRGDDALVVGATPDVLKGIGLIGLPMTINQKHIGDALNGTYKGTQQEKLDHTFTAQELATLPEKLADPVAIIYDKRTGKSSASESNIDVLVEMTVASGKQVLAAVQINGNGRINGIRIDTNKVATVHGNADSVTRLIDAINENKKGNVAVFYLNNDKTTKVLQRTGNPIPSGLSNLDGFINSITDPGSPVKSRITSVTESQQFKRWFGDWQNHPENASKVVNTDGTPKVMYHGSTEQFTVFDKSKAKSSGHYGRGFYFTDTMTEIIIAHSVEIVATLLVTLIGVLGAWLTSKIAKRTELTNISAATNEAVRAAQLTVMELQQTVVDGWKAANEDGKLTEDEVQELGMLLVNKTMAKMSDAAKNLLVAAGVDLTAMIIGAGEALIQQMKK